MIIVIMKYPEGYYIPIRYGSWMRQFKNMTDANTFIKFNFRSDLIPIYIDADTKLTIS